MQERKPKRGPKPKRLEIDSKWEDAVKKAMRVPPEDKQKGKKQDDCNPRV